MWLLLCCILCVVVAAWWWRTREEGPQPPVHPGALPILGHALQLLRSTVYLWPTIVGFMKFSTDVGGVSRIFVGPKTLYMITDPEDSLTVANKCINKGFFYEYAKQWLTYGLVLCEGTLWKKARKQFAPAFNNNTLNQYLGVFNRQSRKLVEQLAVEVNNGPFDQTSHVFRNLLETINETILGLETSSNNLIDENYLHEVESLFDGYIERLQKVWLHSTFLYNRSDLRKRHDRVVGKAIAMSSQVLKKRKAELLNNIVSDNTTTEKHRTVVDFILDNYLNDGFTDDIIRDHMDTFSVASFDTTGATITLILKLIGSHPHVQENIYEELENVFEGLDRDVDKNDLSKLIYLEAVIKETIRLYPVVPVVMRKSDAPVELKNYTIPADSEICICLYGVNRHPSWGDDVNEFRPQRWLDGNAHKRLFAGFSLGRRNCIGEAFAMKLMKTNLVHILRHYRISADRTDAVFKFNTFLRAISSHHIGLQLR